MHQDRHVITQMQQCRIRKWLGWWSKVVWRLHVPCQEVVLLSLLDKSVADQGCADMLRDMSLQYENSSAFPPVEALLSWMCSAPKKGLGEWVSHDLWELQMHNTEQILKCYLLIYLIEMLFMLVLSSPKLLYCLMERWHNKRMTFLCGVMDWLCVGYSRGQGSLPHHMQWVSTKE